MKKLIYIIILVVIPAIAVAGLLIDKVSAPPGPGPGVVKIGATQVDGSSANSGSFDVTVPAGTELVLFGVGGYSGSSSIFSSRDSITFDGQAMTLAVAADSGTGSQAVALFYYADANVPTGVRTIAYNWQGGNTFSEGAPFHVSFWQGINIAAPVGASGGEQSSSGTATAGLLTGNDDGDALIAHTNAFQASASISFTGVNDDLNHVFNDSVGKSGFDAASTGDTIVSASCTSCGNFIAMVAFVMEQSP